MELCLFSHAVGVAFSICLERKQQREVDCGVSMSYNETDGTFTKFGSFRQGTITERIQVGQPISSSCSYYLPIITNRLKIESVKKNGLGLIIYCAISI